MAGELPDYVKPDKLYGIDVLLHGYDPGDPLVLVKSCDFGAYLRYASDRAVTPHTLPSRSEASAREGQGHILTVSN